MSAPQGQLNDRHRLVAEMVAAGHRTSEIARATGFAENHISTLRGSPLFKAVVEGLVRERRDTTLDRLAARIEREAEPSIDVIAELRDHAETESVRLGAAKEFLDRAAPKVTRLEEDRTVRVVLEREPLERLVRAINEDSAGMGEPIDIDPVVEPVEPVAVRSRSIDELLAELEDTR